MTDSLAIIVLAVAGLIAFLVYKVTLSVREAREEKLRALRALGFEPRDPPPAEVAESILALYRNGKKDRHTLHNVLERRGSGDRLYLFDLKDASSDSSQERLVAVFSPRLNVPRLTIFPRLEGDGHLAALGNLLIRKLGQRHGGPVSFAAHERFARRHFVSGPDHEAIRRFLTERRLDRLAQMEHMGVEAEGHRFTYRDIPFGRRKSGGGRDEVGRRVQEAEELLDVLGR